MAARYDRDARVAQLADVVLRMTRALSTRDAELVEGLLTDDVVAHLAEDRISEVFVTIEDQAALDAFLSD